MERAEPRWHRFTTACAGGLDGGQIADLLWMTQLLAAEIPVSANKPAANAALQSLPPQDAQALQKNAVSGRTDTGVTQADSTGASTSAGTQADAPATAPSSRPRALVEPATGIAPPPADTPRVGVGEAGLLPRPRRIGRALAPLGRRVAAGPVHHLDVPATVESIARARVDGSPWRPVLRPRLEPWLSLHLVFDGHPSMALWQRLRRELPRTLAREVRWRDLRCWVLEPGAGGGVALHGPQGQRCNPRRLLQSGDRGLLLVVSDAIAPGWRDGSVAALLASWAEHQPVLLLQVLPPRLWPRSGLGQQEAGWVQAGGPLQPNPNLHWRPFDADPFGTDFFELEEPAQPSPAMLTLPLATMDPDDLAAMARLLNGKGGASLRGFRFALPAHPAPRSLEAAEPPPQPASEAIEQQLALFLFNASPQARRLLGLLSFAPVITLPLVRLIQGLQVAGSGPAQVAEVLFSGLFRSTASAPSPGDAGPAVPVDRQQLCFVDEGLRLRVREGLRVGEARAVWDAVASHVAQGLNLSGEDFEAVLKAPPQESQGSKDDQLRAFASVAPSCLRGLGSRYEQLADAIEQAHAVGGMTAEIATTRSISNESLKQETGRVTVEGSSAMPTFAPLEKGTGNVCIYISFSDSDLESRLWVELITVMCKEQGYDVLYGSRAHSLGELAGLIAASDVLVCLVTSSYESAPLCNAEVNIAMVKGKPLFPVQILDKEHDGRAAPLPFGLDNIQAMRYFSGAHSSSTEADRFKGEMGLAIHQWVANGRKLRSWDLHRSGLPNVTGESIYISYYSRDEEGDAWADQLSEWFREWGYGFFRDKDHIHGMMAGTDLRAQLFRQLQLAQVIVCLVSRSYESSAWCVGELAIAVEKGKTVIPIHLLDTEAEQKTKPLPLLLQDRQAIRVAPASHPSPERLAEVKQRLRRSLEQKLNWRQLQPWDASQPPYPGLPCFEALHAPVFFGRDGAIEAVVDRLAKLALRSPAFLLVLGASGCGKSSLVRAGVVPRLRNDQERGWIVLPPFRPGEMPFAQLAEAVRAGRGVVDAADPLGSLQALNSHSKAPVVLVIDQFEELLVEGNLEGERFLAFMQRLLREELSQVVVLATMRTDYLAPLQTRWPALTGMASTYTLEPIEPEDFRELISGPAERSALTLEPGLLERLVSDSGGRDALPLLALTLEKLWNAKEGQMLTLKAYADLGGVEGAVSTRAAECWNPQTSTDEVRQAMRAAFLEHLVSVGSDGREAKRPAPLAELPIESREIVQRMVDDRLLVQKDGIVEIAHEALLRTWEPLVKWIEEDKEQLLERLRVKRLSDDLNPAAPERQRRQALEQLAGMAAAGGSEARAVRKEAREPLSHLLTEAKEPFPLADQEDAALVLALIGAEDPLRVCLSNEKAPVALRRRAAESLGLMARRCGEKRQRQRIAEELERWLRSEPLNLLVEGDAGWAEHDARLPLLQGASRGLQLAVSGDLPLFGSGPGREVPMLTLTALEEGNGLRIRTEVVEVPVWQLPLPGGEHLELVVVPSGDHIIGSSEAEPGRDIYSELRDGCAGVNVEPERTVRLSAFALVRHPISEGQWRAVVEAVDPIDRELVGAHGTMKLESLWERYGQPGEIAVDSVSWDQGREWLGRLNRWLLEHWGEQGGSGEVLQLALPSENLWEAACRAGSATPFHFGDTLDGTWARYDATAYPFGRGRKVSGKVKQPWVNGSSGLVNRWGLSEMHGQLFEWCEDAWHPNPLGEGHPVNGESWREEDRDLVRRESVQTGWKLLRGGSWFNLPLNCRAAYRYCNVPDYGLAVNGLRPCCPSLPGSLLGP